MLGSASNDCFDSSCDNELFPQLRVFEMELKAILIPSDVSLLKPYNEGQRSNVGNFAALTGYADGESSKKKILIRHQNKEPWAYKELPPLRP